jgi:hypothetical protein
MLQILVWLDHFHNLFFSENSIASEKSGQISQSEVACLAKVSIPGLKFLIASVFL